MAYSNPAVQKLIASYWRSNGVEISKDLLNHQEFLLTFEPSGDFDRDVSIFLVGVGQPEMLESYRQFKLPIRGLAVQIRLNHQEELGRIRQGLDPEWSGKYYRRSPEALKVYQGILELEEHVLTAILGEDNQRQAA